MVPTPQTFPQIPWLQSLRQGLLCKWFIEEAVPGKGEQGKHQRKLNKDVVFDEARELGSVPPFRSGMVYGLGMMSLSVYPWDRLTILLPAERCVQQLAEENWAEHQ